MSRAAYRFIIRMHPPAFQRRFGDEMMSIFDEMAGPYRYALLLDGVSSFARQWLLRTDPWKPFLAVLGAFIQLSALGIVIQGHQYAAADALPSALSAQQVLLFALTLTCTLVIAIIFLVLWNVRFQRRRSTAYKASLSSRK